jgi:hypothetical protein
MGLLNRLGNLFGRSPRATRDVLWIYVRCLRCGEVLRGRIDLRNDPSLEDADPQVPATYMCRKLLSGSGKNLCFQTIEVYLRFDASHNLLEQKVSGGEFTDEAAYQAGLPSQ